MYSLLMFLGQVFSALVFAEAQSSCSSPEVISSPTTLDPGFVQGFNSVSKYEVCDIVSLSSSTLQTGLWFSYTPSETRIVRVVMEGDSLPNAFILSGSCDSLACVKQSILEDVYFQADAGTEYLVYFSRDSQYIGGDPFVFTLEEIEIPVNDSMENAIPLTNQDLPYRGDFTTVGALSDFNQDACGLNGEYGVWFTYTTTLSEELLTFQAQTGNTGDVVGIQTEAAGGGFMCEYIGSSSDLEWVAEGNTKYYILVGDPEPEYAGAFELTLQSRSFLASPISPDTAPAPAPTSPTSPDTAPAPAPASPGSPDSQQSANENEEVPSSSSEAFPLLRLSGTQFGLAIFFVLKFGLCRF